MNKLSFYHKLPDFAQNVLVSVYGFKLRRLRYGGSARAELDRLLESDRASKSQLHEIQRELLRDILEHAANTVPYYRRLVAGGMGSSSSKPDDVFEWLRQWPILNKQDVQGAGRSLISDEYCKEKLVEIHTGGTTGRALAIWTDKVALRKNYAFFERQKRWAGIGTTSRVATFAGRSLVSASARRPPYWRYNAAGKQMLFSSYHISSNTVEEYVRCLEQFKPDYIDSYPSSLESIARHIIARGGTSVSLRAIITSSETLNDETRKTFESAFGCPVFDHYGSAEMVAFVTQCCDGSYHVNSEYGFLEILREDGTPVGPGETGEIVATGFINYGMPLIRYRLGDLATTSDIDCSCGRSHPTLDRIVGRQDDVIVTPDGRRVGRIDPIFKAVNSLYEARVVQTLLDLVRIEVVASASFTDKDAEELISQLRTRLGPLVRVELVHVKSIPRTKRGKLRIVESPFAALYPMAGPSKDL